tara:strand:- start:5 stop:430 length:426 start_codon:yes stop_codon:yes gene_type:complete
MDIETGKILRLKRIATSKEEGTFGVLLDGYVPFAVSLEPPFIVQPDGLTTPNISCIPTGIYVCKRVNSPRFGDTFEVTDVEEGHRSHILFHKGNSTKNTLGCILIGEGFGSLGIERSRQGFDEFKSKTSELDQFILQITEE